MAQATSTDPVTAAQAFANQDENGSGYWLVVTLRSGAVFRGPAYSPAGGVVRLDQPTGDDAVGEPVFLRLDEVAAAQVEW